MSPRSPKDMREDDMPAKTPHVVQNALNEAHAPEKATAASVGSAPVEQAKPDQAVETTVELDRVAIYLKGPTAFSA